ncbi:5-methyltetrahydropteroyltriglutamate--homocysteine methyltransferase-like isoform X1 [Oculina patagonica]
MPLPTTVIGCFPKPSYLNIPDWFQPAHSSTFAEGYNRFLQNSTASEREALFKRAIEEIIELCTEVGLDVITDGEVRRENYIHYFCRRLKGFDFHNLCPKTIREVETGTFFVPRIVGELSPLETEPWVWKEWKISQDLSEKPMKITLPGPMTIADTVADQYYNDDKALGCVLTEIINKEIKALVSAGCKYIQVDEPVLMRYPEQALEYGIDQLATCFDEVTASDVVKTVHLCCGYPNHLDQEDYKKADKDAYLRLADKLDAAGFDEISIEDAHRHNDLSLFKHFKKSKVVLGVVKVASSRVESVDEIRTRLKQVLTVLPAERLVVAPDCGLGFLSTELAKQKLHNMVHAAKSLP